MIVLEELLWTCSCGRPMGLELGPVKKTPVRHFLDCSQCGYMATLQMQVLHETKLRPVDTGEGE